MTQGEQTEVLFQLTTSRRGRLEAMQTPGQQLLFQLTTSRRGRQRYEVQGEDKYYFNSLPHAEVDREETYSR